MLRVCVSLLLTVPVAVMLSGSAALGQSPLGTAFTYQGQLKQGGTPYSGPAQMVFDLYDVPADGTPLATVGPLGVACTNGLFTERLVFGPDLITGEARWLQITVEDTVLLPRQELTPAPHALALPGLWTQQAAASPNLIGGYVGNVVAPNVVGATIGGGGTQAGDENKVFDHYGTVAGGLQNQAGDDLDGDPADDFDATVGGGRGNKATNKHSTVAGGQNNTASESHTFVGGGAGNSAEGYFAVIGGGRLNTASGERSFVGGGADNIAGGYAAAIVGGEQNTASDAWATVGGGWENQATANSATIGGGGSNAASGNYAAVGGGAYNQATARWATIGGGTDNTASGDYATVGGGYHNTAAGDYSLAAGRYAQANHRGAFVWADSTGAYFPSTDDDQFLIRAGGGVGINTNLPGAALHIADTDRSGWDGIMFPDGSLQTTAYTGGGGGGFWSANGDDIYNNNSGNVGIGIAGPNEKLDVDGNIKASGTLQSGASIVIDGTASPLTLTCSDPNEAFEIHVGGDRALNITPIDDGLGHIVPNIVGGASINRVDPGVIGATISGGGGWFDDILEPIPYPNTVTADFGTIGGVWSNHATGQWSTVGGGHGNRASGDYSTVGGGIGNRAIGGWSTVPGGALNHAGGEFSLAAGFRAEVRDADASGDNDGDEGTFVWADAIDEDFTSTGPNQFLIRASGGVGIGTNEPDARLHVSGDIIAESSAVAAITGEATATSGAAYGVYGQSESTSGTGVFGVATATSGSAYGVYGNSESTSGVGVFGLAPATSGSAYGVYGGSASTSGRGVHGSAYAGSGVNYGMYGQTLSPDGYGVYASGGYGGTGPKYFIQPHPTDPSKEIRFVCLEGNESGTYFRGSARLTDGRAVIEVPEEFRLVTEPEGLTVQVTAMGPKAGLWVEEKGLDRIVVRGNDDVEFDYFANGIRRGYADLELIRENHAYVPETRGVPYGTQYREGHRLIMVENGILNPDFTPNEETATRLGWTLKDPEPEDWPDSEVESNREMPLERQ